MKKIFFRITATLCAFLLAGALLYALTKASDETRGPITKLLDKTVEVIADIEQKNILEVRQERRIDQLDWLQPYRKDINLLKKPNQILLGAFDSHAKHGFEGMVCLEDSIQTHFALVHLYTAWGSKPHEAFPEKQVQSILSMGSIPVITWEPWLTDFDIQQFPHLKPIEQRDLNGLADIAYGDYDAYIRAWAAKAAKVKVPIFVRFAHEMNDAYRYPWGTHNNSPEAFKAAWQHIHLIFKQVGATNVLWVYSPHPAYGQFDRYYPGDDYTDYVATGALNYGTVASWSQWWSFDDIFGKHYKALSAFKKPIMIAELGSLSVGGNRSIWFKEALTDLPKRYPAVKAILFFHHSSDKTVTNKSLNWYFAAEQASKQAVKIAIQSW